MKPKSECENSESAQSETVAGERQASDYANLSRSVQQLQQELHEIRSSFGFKLLSRALWPLSAKTPKALRRFIKSVILRRKRPQLPLLQPAGDLVWHLDVDLSVPFPVGRGNLLFLDGWCYHPTRRIKKLSISVNGFHHQIVSHSLASPDVYESQCDNDHSGFSLTSGFWTTIPFEQIAAPQSIDLTLCAILADGSRSESRLGTVQLIPDEQSPAPVDSPAATTAGGEPLVAICLTTFNPPIDLFAQQIESIISQTHQNWVCIISDDHSDATTLAQIERIAGQDTRFRVIGNSVHVGFYHNFERCLRLAPTAAQFIALADQDDFWYPHKLSASLREFRNVEVQMVYSDMDIVSRDGEVLFHTFWTTRKNNYRDFAALILANSVTGGAIVFRAEMLADLLPFPRMDNASMYHDHWIACTALSKGRIGFVDQPLYAYRQHEGNVIGHCVPPPARGVLQMGAIAYVLTLFCKGVTDFGRHLPDLYHVYRILPLRLRLITGVLRLRFKQLPPRKSTILKRLERFHFSMPALIQELVRYKLTRRSSLGMEWLALRAVIAVRLFKMYYRVNRRAFLKSPQAQSATPAILDAAPFIDFTEHIIAPLTLNISDLNPRRVNLLIHAVDFRYVYAGYLSVYNLALQLKRNGYAVRLVIINESEYKPQEWSRQSASYGELSELFADVESSYVYDRSIPLKVSSHDRFIAIGWWMAHVAHQATRNLGQDKFIYLIQEYDPLIFPAGSYYALAAQAYTFPHYAIFSTDSLRDFFRDQGIGVYANKNCDGNSSVVIQNAVHTFNITPEDLRTRKERRLLFYTRPEPQNTRNMFELGVMALKATLREGHFSPECWKFHGIGAVSKFKNVSLDGHATLEMLPKVTLHEYWDLLPTYDLGLALMLTPHPSMVPLDMAAAGLVTVTNTFATKTADRLTAISPNINAVPPTVEGIKTGIVQALNSMEDVSARVAGTRLNWAMSWQDTFNPEVMSTIKRFIGW